jgi:polyferredoxin
MRSVVELTVLRDRAPLFVTLADGSVRNDYTLKILNKSRAERALRARARGHPPARGSSRRRAT